MSFIDIISSNRSKFLQYNSLKFERLQEFFPGKNTARVINALPLMLSLNDKKVPGYVEGDVPAGIVGYEPDQESVRYLQSRFRLQEARPVTGVPYIQMLAVMGSIGTVAYTKKSDFDYWVCVDRHGVTAERFDLFRKKVEAVEKWICQESKTEVNLFINETDKIKRNVFADSGDESLGSTIGALLKDEFYRSSIIIAGKVPFWWVVPRFINDSEYDRLFDGLPEELKEREYIDLGNLYEISKEDFLGAALFLILKSLGNPFKSIIKMGVLEKYLFDTGYSPILCHKVKTRCSGGPWTTASWTPTSSCSTRCTSITPRTGRTRRSSSLQENLYLKINPRLSRYAAMKESKNLPYTVKVMFRYIREWKWTLEKIRELDDFLNWDYARVMTFWSEVKKFILMSYQNIARELPLLDLKEKMTESDFNLLSRKIKSSFSARENKIDQYITFKETPHEAILYLEPLSSGIRELEWKLTKNMTGDRDEIVPVTIKTDRSLLRLLAWVAMNGIYDPRFTRIKIQSGYQRVNQNMAVEVLNRVSSLFRPGNLEVTNDYYRKPAFILACMIIVNFGHEGGDSVRGFSFLYHTSWGESFMDEYASGERLLDVLRRVLQDGQVLRRDFGDFCGMVACEPERKYFRGLEKLFQRSYEFLVRGSAGHALVMVCRFDDRYICIFRDDVGTVSITPHNGMVQLLASLSLSPRNKMGLCFYGDEGRIKIMEHVAARGRENTITLVYEEKGEYILMYLMNERGNLFTFIRPVGQKEGALECLYRFSKNAIAQVNSLRWLPDINGSIPVYRLAAGRDGEIVTEYETPRFEKEHAGGTGRPGCLDVAACRYMTEEMFYSVMFDEKRSTEFMPQSKLAERLRGMEGMGKSFVRKIIFNDFPRDYFAGGTTVYFLEKYRLELIFDRAGK